MVRHQAPAQHLDAGRAAMRSEQVAIKRIVAVTEEYLRAAVATLGDVVRITGDDDTRETGIRHGAPSVRGEPIERTVTVIQRLLSSWLRPSPKADFGETVF